MIGGGTRTGLGTVRGDARSHTFIDSAARPGEAISADPVPPVVADYEIPHRMTI